MPRTKNPENVNTGIDVQRPKTVYVTYRDEAGTLLAAINLKADSTLEIITAGEEFVVLSADQLRDLRRRISQSLNSGK